jgi:hypothetical protein
MANEENEENWDLKLRQDTEQEFFTELALHETTWQFNEQPKT